MSLAVRIFEITFPIFSLVLIGFLYGHRYRPDMSLPNKLNLDVFIPALLFSVLVQYSRVTDLLSQFSLCIVIVILGSGLVAWLISRIAGVQARTLCPPVMFGNAGNLGLPLMTLTFGEQALPIAVVMFVVCNFLHITIGNLVLNQKTRILKALFTPMIVSVVLALLLGLNNIILPEVILKPIRMLGNICVPLMLFALGVRLLDIHLHEWRHGLLAGLLAPVTGIFWVMICLPFVTLSQMEQGILFLFAALPPAVMNYMFAEHHEQEPARVAAMVLFGNALSIITIPLALFYVIPRFS